MSQRLCICIIMHIAFLYFKIRGCNDSNHSDDIAFFCSTMANSLVGNLLGNYMTIILGYPTTNAYP